MSDDWPLTGRDARDPGTGSEPTPGAGWNEDWNSRLGGSPFAKPAHVQQPPRRVAEPTADWDPDPPRRAEPFEDWGDEAPSAPPTGGRADPSNTTLALSGPTLPRAVADTWAGAPSEPDAELAGGWSAPTTNSAPDAGPQAPWQAPSQLAADPYGWAPAATPDPVPDWTESVGAQPPAPAWAAPSSGRAGHSGAQSFPGTTGFGTANNDPSTQQPGFGYPQRVVPVQGYEPPSRALLPVTPQQHAAPLPPKRRTGVTVAYSVVGVLVAAMVAGLVLPAISQLPLFAPVQSPTATPSPVAASPAATAGSATSSGPATSAPPSSTPSAKATTPTSPVKILKQNPLYTLKVPASCPKQSIPSSSSAFRSQVKGLVACLNKSWRKALAKTDVEFSKPKIKFYKTSIETACSTLGSNFPAAYCTGDNTLYFSSSAYKQGGYYRLAVAQFVMHEYGHHVQWLTGIFENSRALDESSNKTSRRIELQAHCMAHYQLTHSKVDFDGLDRVDVEYQFDYTNDPSGHGSTKAERYWGERGLDGKSMNACNTWKVPASKVK